MVAPLEERLVVSRASAWAGLFSGLLLNAALTLEGALRPDYHADGMFISELSLGPRGVLQNINFLSSGLLLLVAARNLRSFGSSTRYVTLAAIGLLGAGLFNTDPFPRTITTIPGFLHDGFALLCFTGMIAAGFTASASWRNSDRWRSWAAPTRAATLTMSCLFAMTMIGFRTPWKPAPEVLVRHIGTLQRLAELCFFGWFVSLNVALLRMGSGDSRSDEARAA